MITINSPLTIANLTLKNRVVVPPMASQTADNSGYVTDKTIAHYTRLSQSKASLIMVEYSYVHQSGKSEPNQLGINLDDQIEGLSKLAQVIKSNGAYSAIQLTHAGGKSNTKYTGGRMISPSGIVVPVKDTTLETPDSAKEDDIKLLQNSFLEAAIRANKAGFDIVEIHSAHGYGINQWLSPITNTRIDQYGGSLENRFRLLSEIIKLIKNVIPTIILSVRIPGKDHLDEGLSTEDSQSLAKALESLGVKIINVSSGIGGWRRPENRDGEGYLVEEASIIQKAIGIPVIGVGGIKTAEYINRSLQSNSFSLAAVGRAILNSPEWGTQAGLK